VELVAGDAVNFRLIYPRPAGEKLTLRALRLDDLPAGHREFVIVTDERGSTIATRLLRAQNPAMEVPLSAGGVAVAGKTSPPESPSTAWGFIKLGIEHIWTGYDHLLFLFGLLVVCRTFRSIIAIVSCFTVAHSLTLALATLNLVTLPNRLVESAIAASIVYVGVENLWRHGAEPRGRWLLTFAFGLVHGFGFASVLRELGIGAKGSSIAVPLLGFNFGVELGQIAVAVAVLPLVWQLRKNATFVRLGVPILSGLIALAGLCWLLQRSLAA
jgi:hydrogenase/urease accessory protein HupE